MVPFNNFGDDKDRVLIKSDGSFTYLTPDIAYHEDKFVRGFDKLINIWGADHHGYIPRMKAAIEALGYDRDTLKLKLSKWFNCIKTARNSKCRNVQGTL